MTPVSPPIPPIVQSTPPVTPPVVVPPAQVNTPQQTTAPQVVAPTPAPTPTTQQCHHEEPTTIVIVNPKPTVQNTANSNAGGENTTTTIVIQLENHRNQSKDETNDSKHNKHQLKLKPKPTKQSTLANSPKPNYYCVRSAAEALKILENYRKNKQGSTPNAATPAKTIVKPNNDLLPQNLPNEKAPADTLNDIVAQIKANNNYMFQTICKAF